MADNAYGSRENLRRRSPPGPNADVIPPAAGYYQPGQPIGFLKARGTPYEKKYLSRKLGFCCLFIAPFVILVVLAITLVPVLYAVANHTLKTSVLSISASNITSPGNASFPLTLEGQARKVGIFPAHLYFREPVQVFWTTPPPDLREVNLGQLTLDYIGVAAGHGRIKQATNFIINDQDAFAEFARFLITQPQFTWKLRCDNVHVEAFSFLPTYKNLEFSKNINIKGFNNFEDVAILDFQLPGDDPEGGITFQAITSLTNPSPFGVQIGSLEVALYYKGMFLGPASTSNLNVTAGVNVIALGGRLVPHNTNQTELDLLGELFTGYINGETVATEARGVSATQTDGSKVAWLSEGISALTIAVPLKAPTPINPIKSIVIGSLALIYTPETAYMPTVFSSDLSATLALPFGFSLDIVNTANSITLLFEGAQVGTINGAYSNSTTTLNLISAGQTAGTLDLTLPPSPLTLPNQTEDARQELENFQKFFTFSNGTGIGVQGAARAVTDTPLGRVLLDGILFDVDSGILGLEGLAAYPTIINTVDVVGGSQDGINLVVGTTLVNPSNLNLSIGDVNLQLAKDGSVLGTVTLHNLDLLMGRNDVNATSSINPNVSPAGYETLNRFISGQDTLLNINGFNGSSAISSLVPALSPLRLNATLPGLETSLVKTANLTVLETTGIVDDVADSVVFLQNPFTSALTITAIKSNVTSHGIFVASIDTPLSFNAPGKSVTQSPPIPLNLNLYPPDIFGLVRALVVQSGQDPVYIDGLVQLGGYTLTPTTAANNNMRRSLQKRDVSAADDEEDTFDFLEDDEMAQTLMGVGNNAAALAEMEAAEGPISWRYVKREDPQDAVLPTALSSREVSQALLQKRDNIFTGFDLPTYISRAFSVATANLEIVADAQIGDFGTTLTFSQSDVPLGTDVTLNRLLPVLAGPIVQKIVDGAVLNVDRVTILNPQLNSFTTALQGTITDAGPFDAVIQFPQGLTVTWEGRALGQLAFPNVSLAGDVGATLELEAEFAVADVDYLTEFTKFLLTEPSFVWNIAGQGLTVSALGIAVSNVSISKDVILSGFNNLPRDVIINSFDLPSNDPAGGIHLTADSTIYNPSQVGVQLSRFGVNINRNDTFIAPSAAASEFTLQALAVTELSLVGRLVPQTSQEGLAALSEIFTNFVNNVNTDVTINGDYAGPESVTWLNEGIKVLRTVVSLPSQRFQVIRSISLNQLSLFFTQQTAWSPSTSSSDTTASFFLPFAFPIDIQQAGGDFIANYQNRDVAVLNIPPSPSITDVAARILTLMFTNVPFDVYDDQHPTFSQFLTDVTAGTQVRFNLNGRADTKANTAAGLVTISDIPFNVDTNILGLQNLNARPVVVSDLDVNRGFPSYLLIKITATLFNPSDITIGTGDVTFDLFFMGRPIGTAVIYNLVLVPGENRVPVDVRYSPQGAANVAAGQMLLENYVQGIVSDTVISGNQDTTPIESLKQALSGISLAAQIPPLNQLLITQAALTIPRDIAQTGIASATFMLQNPFTASINLLQVRAEALYQGIYLGVIDQNLRSNPIRAAGHTTITSYPLPFQFNLDPKNLIRFVIAAAANTGTDLGPLPPLFDQVLNQASTQTTINPVPDDSAPPCSSGNQFDVQGAVLRSLRGLTTTLNVDTTLKLDEYQTDLSIVQQPVPTITDQSALYLLGPAGAPIVQNIVDQAVLTVAIANVTDVTNDGFNIALQGALLNTGPFDAYIEFTEPLTVIWQGSNIATLSLPPICALANEGVPNLVTSGSLRITNLGRFTDFATFILANPSFQWTVTSNQLRVRALGIVFNDVIITKTINLQAFNGLPGVTTSNFQIPGETSNSLLFQTEASIPSPATLGIELDTANFRIFFMGTNIGPAQARGLFLAALATTQTTLYGEITAKSGQDLANTGILFTNFLQGIQQVIQARGVSVVTQANGNQPVNWLTTAFKTLTIDATLPGRIYQIIFSITISDLTVKLNGDPADSYNIPSSSNSTIATFANPFMFSLQPVQTAARISIVYEGGNTAQLNLPNDNVQAGTSRGPTDFQILQLMWRDVPLVAQDQANFQQFLRQLTDFERGTFDLRGAADVVARTVIGDVPIGGIPFNVTSTLTGINSFNGVATILRISISSGAPAFVWAPLTVSLFNPSNLTVITKAVFLPVTFMNVFVGRAEIPDLGLIPGNNDVQAYFYYAPNNANDTTAQELLTRYAQPSLSDGVSPQSADLLIDGSAGPQTNLTPYDSLRPALAGVKLATVLNGVALKIVTHVNVYIGLDTILSGVGNILLGQSVPTTAEITVELQNGLDTNLFLVGLSASAKIAGSQPRDASNPDAQVTYTFPDPVDVPANNGTATSPRVPDVVLTQGLLGSLDVLGQNLDLYNQITANLGQTASDSYRVPALQYSQLDIPTTYFIDASPLPVQIPVLGDGTQLQKLLDLLKSFGSSADGPIADLLNNVLGNGLGGLTNATAPLVCGLAGIVGGILPLDSLDKLLNGASCPDAPGTTTTSAANSTTALASTLESVASSAVDGLTSAVGGVTSVVGGAVTSAVGGVTSALGGATSVLGNVVGGVTSAAAPVETAVGSVVGDATSAVGGVVDGLGSVVGGVLGLSRRDLPRPTSPPIPPRRRPVA